MERPAEHRRYSRVLFGRDHGGKQPGREILRHRSVEGSAGVQRAPDFGRAGGSHARRSAGIHAGKSHHGRSHAGGNEGQVSAPASHSRAARLPGVADPVRYTSGFSYRGSRLFCEGVPVEEVAEQVGTPAYLYSHASIEQAYRRMDSAFGSLPHTICYAAKANSNLGILCVFAALGSGFDIVSGGELYRLRRIGVPGNRIVFSGVGKSREEIREALRTRILLFNVESAAELDLLASEASRLRVRAAASIRVNPDVKAGGHPHIATGHHRHKFGIDWETARGLYLQHRDSRWIDWQGISAHIGSQILTLAPHRRALTRLAGFVRELARAGIALRYLDCGGGLGIRYTAEQPPDTAAYAAVLARAVRPLGCHLLIEPGRSLAGPAGVILMRVLYTCLLYTSPSPRD